MRQLSHASPRPSASVSTCVALATKSQLSVASTTPSLSASLSQALPTPSPSASAWVGLATPLQLSPASSASCTPAVLGGALTASYSHTAPVCTKSQTRSASASRFRLSLGHGSQASPKASAPPRSVLVCKALAT